VDMLSTGVFKQEKMSKLCLENLKFLMNHRQKNDGTLVNQIEYGSSQYISTVGMESKKKTTPKALLDMYWIKR
jgi:hypothetical protein